MTQRSQSQRVIDALNQLEQYVGVVGDPEKAVCLLSGAVAVPIGDEDETEHGLITVTFPGGGSFDVIGAHYLRLKIVESARLERDSPGDGEGRIADRAGNLLQHLERKHGLSG